jgi:archaeal flagellar protein FlaF
MAVAEIIGAAIGVLLLVIVAYLLVGGTLTTAETLATAQKDLTLQNEARIRTNIELGDISTSSGLTFSVKNTGNEIISDFNHMDIISYNATTGYNDYQYDPYNTESTRTAGNWTITSWDKDYIHPRELDPGEKMWVLVTYPTNAIPIQFQITTSNGVSASTVI